MIKDRVVVATIAGMIASVIKDIPNFIYYKMGLVKVLYANLAASAHLIPSDLNTTIGYTIGFLGDTITGGAMGLIAIEFLRRYGNDYWWYKGLIIGNTLWLFGLGVIPNLGAINLLAYEPWFRLTSFFDHLLYGIIVVYIITIWNRAIEQQSFHRR